MARQRIQLTSTQELEENKILHGIKNGEFSKEEFHALPQEMKDKVNDMLFDLSSSEINLFHGTSALEFISIAAIRLLFRYKQDTPLSETDRALEKMLEEVLEMHQIGNQEVDMADWLFDYISYTKYKTAQILRNREEHIERKIKVTGNV